MCRKTSWGKQLWKRTCSGKQPTVKNFFLDYKVQISTVHLHLPDQEMKRQQTKKVCKNLSPMSILFQYFFFFHFKSQSNFETPNSLKSFVLQVPKNKKQEKNLEIVKP